MVSIAPAVAIIVINDDEGLVPLKGVSAVLAPSMRLCRSHRGNAAPDDLLGQNDNNWRDPEAGSDPAGGAARPVPVLIQASKSTIEVAYRP